MKHHGSRFAAFLLFPVLLFSLIACTFPPQVSGIQTNANVVSASLLAKTLPQGSQRDTSQSVANSSPLEEAPLRVTATQPSDGSVEVDPQTQVIVVFNWPIVPLTGIEEQAALPQPLTFEPAVQGTGQWINTSVYSFQPEPQLMGSTAYTVTVAELESVSGEALAGMYAFSFTTTAPVVVNARPTGDRVPPDAVVTVEFSQPMDVGTTSESFSLQRVIGDDGEAVAGEITWDAAGETLSFTPTAVLEFGQSYSIEVTKEALSASQTGNLREPFASTFSVVPYPDIVNITPADGSTGVSPDISVVIRFNTHVSPTQAIEEVQVTPLLTTTRVYSYYSPYNDELMLSWYKEPNTEYTVTVGGDIEDEYGNTLGEDRQFTFVTGDYPPFVNLELERFTHFTADEDLRVGVVYRNVDTVNANLYELPQRELLRLASANQWEVWNDYEIPNGDSHLIWRRAYDTSGDINVSIRQIISVTNEAGNPLTPGAYFLDVASPEVRDSDGNPLEEQAVLIVSNANLVVKRSANGPSLVWLTDLASGEPIGNIPVSVYREGEQIGVQRTDADGTATLNLEIPYETNWYPVIAISGEPGEEDYAVASSDWSSGIAPWEFDLMAGWGGEPIKGHFYTDRPIYRPGDTVNWKGIVRILSGDQYQLPPADFPIRITVRDGMGTVIAQEQVLPNEMGTVNGDVTLTPEAGTGFYFLEALLGPEDRNPIYSGVGFQVAEYRTPEFEVNVETEEAGYVQGETVRVTVEARYFSGTPLSDAPLTWRLITEPYFFSWSDEDGTRYSFSPFDPESASYDPYRGVYAFGLINEGSGVTDADGSFVIELPADISGSLASQNWAFDVTVQSGTNQFVTGRTTVPVHRAAFYIGLAPRKYVVQEQEVAEIDVVTLTPEYEPYPGAELEVVVYDFNWNSVYEQAANGSYRWETSVERSPIYTTTLTTNRSGRALLSWTPENAGQVQIVASGEDEAGNHTTSAEFIWVSAGDSDEYVAWPMENNDRIDIVADRQQYAPGDTARVLVPSPYQGPVRALVTEERAGVLTSEVLTLDANSETLEIPITEQHIPNIYVGVILVKGVDETNPFPSMRVGYVMLSVDTSAVELTVDADGPEELVRPGSTVTYTLEVSDSQGRPVPNAEVSAALVDKAILSLAGTDETTLVDAFYSNRPIDVSTGASLVINRDRVSQQLSEGAKGGGGGPGGALEVRTDFRDVAYWAAELMTDAEGRIEFAVELPDSLTTWQLVAKAVTEETKVGEAQSEIIATKELQIRPLVPRFLTAGDRPWLGAQLLNTSEMTVTGTLTYTLTGARFADGDSKSFRFELEPGGQTVESWPAEVPSVANGVGVTAVAIADADGSPQAFSDAISLTVPVARYESPETVATAGTAQPGQTVERIVVPEAATDQGSLQVRVEPGLAGGMIEGLDYLQHYPYECNEQVVSRFLPNLVTVRALRALDIENAALESQLSYQLGIGVQRLVTRQNPDGGWGYWPGEDSSPFITAYVLWGISLAEQQGFAIPSSTRENAVAYLDSQFEAPSAMTSTWRLNELAFVHYVLSEVDAGDPGRASTLYDVREKLGIYGKALLAMALANMEEPGTSDARVQTLLDDIVGAAVLSATGAHWEEGETDFWTLNTDTRTTSIVLSALTRLRPDQPLLPQTVRWLMVTREAGRWSNTQENAWAIIGLTDWLVASGELDARFDWSVELNGDELGSGTASPGQFNEASEFVEPISQLLRDEANELVFSRDGESGQLYYTAHLQYYLDASAIGSLDRGIIVGRRFLAAAGSPGGAISSAAVGDVISVTVTIIAPNDLHQVLVEAPIPAGTEPIDPQLGTTASQFEMPGVSAVDGDAQDGWWRHWVPTHTDYRDDKVALFATFLPAGTYEYTFNVRASLPGEYRVLPVYAEMMYFNEVWGRSEGSLFTVTQ